MGDGELSARGESGEMIDKAEEVGPDVAHACGAGTRLWRGLHSGGARFQRAVPAFLPAWAGAPAAMRLHRPAGRPAHQPEMSPFVGTRFCQCKWDRQRGFTFMSPRMATRHARMRAPRQRPLRTTSRRPFSSTSC